MLTEDQVRLRLDHVLRRGDTPFDAIERVVVLLRETLVPLAEENARLRRDLHLSELSRGVPSVAENACDYRSHGTQWGCARCGIPATGQPTVGGDS